MQVVVIAGGFATRMRPLSEKTPKSLFPVKGKPFIDYQLALFKKEGANEVVLCLGYLGNQVAEFIGNGKRWGLNVRYSWDETKPLGTAGALKNAAGLLEQEFLLTWGDSYVRTDYDWFLSQHRRSGYDCSMGLFCNKNSWDNSNVIYENGRIQLYRKGRNDKRFQYIDVGLSAYSRRFVEAIPPDTIVSLDEIWNRLSTKGLLGGIEIADRFYEIGSFDGYKQFESYVASNPISLR